MDQHELFMSCRRGDLSKLTYLVEQKEVDLNVRDKWDSTPLYYACLCGYTDVVKYLLDNGAKCEANTFDGERCLYAALTNKIKKLLRSYNMVSSRTMRRDLYDEFLRRLLEDASHTDVVFHIHQHSFPAHRSVLCARSQYFSDMFETRWHHRREIRLSDKRVLPSAFFSILHYLYTGRLEVSMKDIEHCQLLVKQCHLHDLSELIEKEIKKINSFESSKLGVEVTMLSSAPATERVQEDLGKLADMALPSELSNLAFAPEFIPLYADICFDVNGHKFSCHKAFFCGRSDYFKVMLLDHFREFEPVHDSLPVFSLRGVSIDVFVSVLYYIYQNSCRVDKSNVYEVLSTADMYLLPGLKRMCAGVIGEFMETDNVISMLRTARIYNLPRLQNQCYQYMADNLQQMVTLEEFSDLVTEDASDVKMREEADTIDVIDEIRFHLTNFVQTFSDVEEANEKLLLIDNLLESLDLEG